MAAQRWSAQPRPPRAAGALRFVILLWCPAACALADDAHARAASGARNGGRLTTAAPRRPRKRPTATAR